MTILPTAPIVILARPQMGENIGSAARAMMNCGLSDLRLVAPRDGWPNPAALPMAAGGSEIIENARVYDNLADAAFDVSLMVAASARRRDLPIKSADPRAAAMMMLAHERQSMASPADAASSGRVAMLFGPEASGLDNDEVVLADILVTAPLNPSYPSLNSGAGGFVDGMGMANGCLSCKPARRYCGFRSIDFGSIGKTSHAGCAPRLDQRA